MRNTESKQPTSPGAPLRDLPEHTVVKPPQPFKPAALKPNERFVHCGVLLETRERHDAVRLVDETRGETISDPVVGREQLGAPQYAGDTRILTSSATPANRHFQSYPQTGNNVDIAEPTRLTLMYGPAVCRKKFLRSGGWRSCINVSGL